MTDIFEILISDMEKNKEYDKILYNLLAILNRDGGHYLQEHGLTKSVMHAINTFNESRNV